MVPLNSRLVMSSSGWIRIELGEVITNIYVFPFGIFEQGALEVENFGERILDFSGYDVNILPLVGP